MNLFFETRDQALVFLAMMPLGFATSALMSLGACAGRFRPLWDVLAMLGCGLGLIALLVMTRDGGVRLYQLLALLTGALLNLLGAQRLARAIARAFRRRKRDEGVSPEKITKV